MSEAPEAQTVALEPCLGCGAVPARRYEASGGAVLLCAACAAMADLGCP